jgi:hypothetical protein
MASHWDATSAHTPEITVGLTAMVYSVKGPVAEIGQQIIF